MALCCARGLLKSGLGRLGLVQRPPAPGDYDTARPHGPALHSMYCAQVLLCLVPCGSLLCLTPWAAGLAALRLSCGLVHASLLV